MTKPITNILIIVAIAAVLFVGYSMLFGGDDSDSLLTSSRGENDRFAVAEELLVLLNSLQGLEIDPSFLESDAFKSLRDFSVTLPPAEPGRRNPFAPLE